MYLRSGWELLYCQFLDKSNIVWEYEPKKFRVLNGKYYIPDFYLPELNEWHEVKGKWYAASKRKFNEFQKLYPNEVMKIIDSKQIQKIKKQLEQK